MAQFIRDYLHLLFAIISILLTALAIVLWQDRGEIKADVKAIECRVDEGEKRQAVTDTDVRYIKKRVDEILKEVRK